MENLRRPHFTYAQFRPDEVETITGLSPTLIRDWRRRGLIHESYDRGPDGFDLHSVANFMLLRRLSDHGLGPKRVYGWSDHPASLVASYALDDRAAWSSDDSWAAWTEERASGTRRGNKGRYWVIYSAPHGSAISDDLSDAFALRDVGTVIDMQMLGQELRERADRTLATVRWTSLRAVEE